MGSEKIRVLPRDNKSRGGAGTHFTLAGLDWSIMTGQCFIFGTKACIATAVESARSIQTASNLAQNDFQIHSSKAGVG
jgi:hypothetical protein